MAMANKISLTHQIETARNAESSIVVQSIETEIIFILKGMATSTEAQFALRVQGVHIVIATGSQSARTAKVILK